MATRTPSSRCAPSSRLALRPVPDRGLPYGAWWPESRRLSERLGRLLETWPAEEDRAARVPDTPPDRDDHPQSVAAAGRRIKTGSFPRDDTHELTLSMLDRTRRTITVIPPDSPESEARGVLDGVTSGADHLPGEDDEDGHL